MSFSPSVPFNHVEVSAYSRGLTFLKDKKEAVSSHLGRKISEIDPAEAKQFGFTALKIAGANILAVSSTRVLLYSWDFALDCVATVLGDTLALPATIATIAVGGAYIAHKFIPKEETKNEYVSAHEADCVKKVY